MIYTRLRISAIAKCLLCDKAQCVLMAKELRPHKVCTGLTDLEFEEFCQATERKLGYKHGNRGTILHDLIVSFIAKTKEECGGNLKVDFKTHSK